MRYNQYMFQSCRKDQLHSIIVAVLLLVVMGTLVFLRAEIFHDEDIEMSGNKPYSNGMFVPVDHTIDWLAENIISANRTKRATSPAFRNRVARVLVFFETHSAAEYQTLFSIHTANSDYFPNNKNAFPLKLRI